MSRFQNLLARLPEFRGGAFDAQANFSLHNVRLSPLRSESGWDFTLLSTSSSIALMANT